MVNENEAPKCCKYTVRVELHSETSVWPRAQRWDNNLKIWGPCSTRVRSNNDTYCSKSVLNKMSTKGFSCVINNWIFHENIHWCIQIFLGKLGSHIFCNNSTNFDQQSIHNRVRTAVKNATLTLPRPGYFSCKAQPFVLQNAVLNKFDLSAFFIFSIRIPFSTIQSYKYVISNLRKQ